MKAIVEVHLVKYPRGPGLEPKGLDFGELTPMSLLAIANERGRGIGGRDHYPPCDNYTQDTQMGYAIGCDERYVQSARSRGHVSRWSSTLSG